jgi:hypothetical protein
VRQHIERSGEAAKANWVLLFITTAACDVDSSSGSGMSRFLVPCGCGSKGGSWIRKGESLVILATGHDGVSAEETDVRLIVQSRV